ncbi:MAG: O-acetyl-ADP-ribose deacetylase [Planctomycetota bacterium]
MTETLVVNSQIIELVQGDITDQHVDAIVNAANCRLAGGSGVDGAIHRRGGPSIMAETRRRYPEGCPTGSAVISTAGELPARFVIHAVGPIWDGGDLGEADLLASAHRRCLELAIENDCRSIAFPAISTGVYGYPTDKAAATAIAACADFLREYGKPNVIRFVLFSRDALQTFTAALRSITTV